MNLEQILQQTGISTIQETSQQLLEKFKLNWSVEKLPLSLPDGSPSGFFGITRTDIKETFATCKGGYEVFQNSELLDLVNQSANILGLKLDNGGSFKQGGLVYLQLQNGNIEGIGENKDTIKRFVTAINSHDGSTSLRWGLTNVTISCMNSFWHAYKSVQNSVKHTESMRGKIEQIVKQINKVQEIEKSLYETFFKLSEAPVQKTHISQAVKTVLGIDLDRKASEQELTTYQMNRLHDLTGAINKEMRQKGETLWGLFSGVTYYSTHLAPGGEINRSQSKAIGQMYEVDNKVFSELVEVLR